MRDVLTKLQTGEAYAHRPGSVNLNLTMEREAAQILDTLAPGKKRRSALLARLLYEELSRRAERAKIVEELRGKL
jgi:hypothetical protein